MLFQILTVIALVILLAGCETIRFYQQAIVGQGRLLLDRRAVESLMEAPETDPALRYRLQLAQDALAYAGVAGLPVAKAYDSYVETDRQFVIWNVFASPALELSLKTSCYPIAGCVSYRGYFKREDAERQAASLRQQGYDVHVGGATAYSTLGWFDDPLLDTFLFRDEEYLVALLFHELAHRLVYIKGDTRFNESLATSVERYVLREWLITRGDLKRFERYAASEFRRQSVLQLINATREQLRELYASDKTENNKLRIKSELIGQLVEKYGILVEQWAERAEYSYWMQGEINNAKLETVADYNRWVPVMSAYLTAHGLEAFGMEMKRLASLPESERHSILESILYLQQ